jgi:hypothetical protein
VQFTIHNIYSKCSTNPLSILSDAEEINYEAELSFFPNPVNDKIYLSEGVSEYEIYSSDGVLINTGEISDPEIEVAKLKEGVYFMKLTGMKHSVVKKLIKI